MFMHVEIAYFGHSSFRLKGRVKAVITDPYGEQVGKYPRDAEADIITVSHDHFDHNAVEKIKGLPSGKPGRPFVIDGPGEYEIGGVSVVGVPAWHDEKSGGERGLNTIYVIEMDGLRIAHMGDLGHKLNDQQLEEIGAIDVVFVPVGGVYTIDAKTAKEVVGQVDPWVIIPMHYKTADFGLKDLGTIDDFLKEMGKTEIVPVAKYSISADRLPEDMQLVVLEKK
jgi:L-ascorbate metabolism protein UlaG (beta-lactamase superfamily)